MEISGDRQLKYNLMKMFLKRPNSLADTKVNNKLLVQEEYSLEDLFFAKYDPLFIENITKKQVFFKVMDDLSNMIKSQKQLKGSSKNRKGLLIDDPDFLKNFLLLLFTPKEKKLLYQHLISTFNIKQEKKYYLSEDQESQDEREQEHSLKTLQFILQNIFGIGQPSNELSEENQRSEE